MRGNDLSNRFELRAGLLQDALTDLDMALHFCTVFWRQRPGMIENSFRNTNLPQIAQTDRAERVILDSYCDIQPLKPHGKIALSAREQQRSALASPELFAILEFLWHIV